MAKSVQFYIILILSIVCVPAAYLFAAAAFVVHMWGGDYEALKIIKNNRVLMIFFAYTAMGVFFSDSTAISAMYGVLMLLCLYSAGLCGSWMKHISISQVEKLIYMVSVGVFMIGIFQYLSPDFTIPGKWVDSSVYTLRKRVYSTFFNPNVFGFYINIVLITVCGSMDMKRLRPLEVLTLSTGVCCLFLTFSRTAWISLIISLLASSILLDKKYFKFALLIGASLIIPDNLLGLDRSHISRAVEDSSLLYRLELWQVCARIIRDNMLTGIGFGMLFKKIPMYSSTVKPTIEHCHNVYIQVLTETGITGFGVFLYGIFHIIKALGQRAVKLKNNRQWSVLSSAVIMIFIHSFMDSVLLTPQAMLVVCMFSAALSSCAKGMEAMEDPPEMPEATKTFPLLRSNSYRYRS